MLPEPMDYAAIKALAKKRGCRATDLIALAPQNDPFYVGTESQLAFAQWFRDLWDQFGYANGVHLRRIHYQIISQDPPLQMPNGKPYENTENCWVALCNASKYARYLGMVDPAAFDDRRNNQPLLFVQQKDMEGELGISVTDRLAWPGFAFPPFPEPPRYIVEGFEAEQRYHLEVWAEKSTMNDILEPVCRRYQANLITGLGELSLTHVNWLVDRLSEYQRTCRIFYISDFDPAGLSMPVSVARKIEKLLRDEEEHFDVRLFPLVLTQDQCEKYRLPRTPIKETERRQHAFEERFG